MTARAWMLLLTAGLAPAVTAASPPLPRAADSAKLQSIAFEPSAVLIDRPEAPRQLQVVGRFSDGSVRDLTAQAKFWSWNREAALVTEHGLVTGLTDGRVRLDANVAGRRARLELTVQNAARARVPAFATHVVPILTRAGCNGGNCHGSPVGKNGFKLSLFGYEPQADFEAMVRGGGGRRVNLAEPVQSLILRKPTLMERHGGGQRFEVGAPEYLTLLNYLKAGAPAPGPQSPVIERLEVHPGERQLVVSGQRQQLVVVARYSDGTQAEVTGLTQFSSNDEGIATVTPSGTVTAVGLGVAPIMIRHGGKVTVAMIAATSLPPLAARAEATLSSLIDRHVAARLRYLRIPAGEPCSDAEFLRRAYLDLIGTLPTVAEVRAFLADRAPDRRARLVDALLARPEYADLQALMWADRLRSNSRFHRVGGVKAYHAWLKETFARNLPLNEFATALLTARGANYDVKTGPANYWGSYDTILRPDEVAPQTSQLFMGIRLHCAQCHNHPFERWTQNDFYALAAVFAQVSHRNTKNNQEFELFLDPAGKVTHPDTKQVMTARAMDSPTFKLPPGVIRSDSEAADLRVPFAKWLTAPDNPHFARALANRLWREFMGRGLVEPVDDFRVTNPPTHPELLDALARELVTHNFDQKHVIRLICNSQAYRRSARATHPAHELPVAAKYYARFQPKRMLAEVYLDAICQVTGVPEQYKNWPEAQRALQLPENRYPSYFLDTFNRTNRLVICEREEEGTMTQALNLINGTEIQSKLAAKSGTVQKLIEAGRSDEEIITELFLGALARYPSEPERDRLHRQRAGVPRAEALQDLAWALLSSREFMFNH